MGFLGNINLFISLVIDGFKQFGRGKAWLVLFGYFLISWWLLYFHTGVDSPVLSGSVLGWAYLFDAQRAEIFSHYPAHYILLPYFFGWAKFILGIFIEGLVLGLATIYIYDAQSGTKTLSKGSFVSRWISMSAGWLILNGLIMIVSLQLPPLAQNWTHGSPRRELFFEFGVMGFVFIVIMTLFMMIIPSVAIKGENVLKAFMRSLRIFRKMPLTLFLYSIFLLFIPIIISGIGGRSAEIVKKFHPEFVYWILFIGLIVNIFVGFFWSAAAARIMTDESDA